MALSAGAQTQWSPERSGGVYFAYPVQTPQILQIPDGFEVFYVSHYGRHGSRWLPDQERYDWVWEHFRDKKNLTKQGREVRKKLDFIVRNARGNAGQLTLLGAQQHRDIARRMVNRFPQAFSGDDTRILARSSTVPRCRASMLAFCDELQRQVKGLQVNPTTDAADMAWINHESAELKALSKATKRLPLISPERFVSQFFTVPSVVDNPAKLLSEFHTIASDMQDIPLDIDLFKYMTREEMEAVHDANNERMTIVNGLTPLNDGIPARSSIALWENIEREADEIIEERGHGASLRFGHDTALYRLLTLLQLILPGEGMEDFLPMAANLQMVFCRPVDSTSRYTGIPEYRNTALSEYRNSGITESRNPEDILVAFLLNEQPLNLPISSAMDGFFRWQDVKSFVHAHLHELEHVRQLAALNTMVGTAPANTRTAGLFGKGSEEHGQTLPAVLVPNGQTFWTPQTRQTEKKCVAPYYYTDSLFQGIRASHWLVGGCTQDYGSFTLAALRHADETTVQRGTRFSHADETSHPYYYAVTLPDEQLRMELTALSHSAIVRVTPTADGPLTIVLTVNSDEQEGHAEVAIGGGSVYAYNPVHRIYQGWGERAGFSGHLFMTYDAEPTACRQSDQKVQLTFDGRRGLPIEVRLSTSFTGLDGATRNHEFTLSFDEMAQKNVDAWIRRLHTIDVEDPDTARVNQFYSALYRASFLPREMSDVDGCYPRFSPPPPPPQGRGYYIDKFMIPPTEVSKLPSLGEGQGVGSLASFGDFSMWDTYRALHPLYNIIVPDLSGQMMQSLVRMYEEGGWLPIFPCWNSYTAAMIGDHCSSVLADACVKGIRGVDYEKAYEAMRKNAMESPKTFDEYKNGMGRRALTSYLKYGYIPLEDSVMEAFHTKEQTSRTLEYAYDDFCVAQLARALGKTDDYQQLMQRSENWRNVINPQTGYADGRHADGSWENNTDLVHRKPYITEGATCHYTWYVPQNVAGLIDLMGGKTAFSSKLDSMFTQGRYWHGNEPCHQVPWLFSLAGQPEKTRQWVRHILDTEYNDTAGGLSGNDDAGQMSAWQVFAMMGFYPVCPGTTEYVLGAPTLRRITLNQPSGRPFVIECDNPDASPVLNGVRLDRPVLDHSGIVSGGRLVFK